MNITTATDGTVIITGASADEKRGITRLAKGNEPAPRLGNISDAAAILGGCSTKSVERLVKAGHIKVIRFSRRRLRYNLDSVTDFARRGISEETEAGE